MTISAESFLKNVAKHTMIVELDQGNQRSIFFGQPGSSNQYFRINTWRGHLCISGDMGCFVFSRTDDMFSFFRDEVLRINKSYWGEKLQAVSLFGGYKKYCPKEFTKRVTDHFEHHKESAELTDDQSDALWEAIKDCVLVNADDGELYAYHEVTDFEHNGFSFQDFFDGGGTENYSYQYIWCLYAIVWGIQQCDATKAQSDAPPASYHEH